MPRRHSRTSVPRFSTSHGSTKVSPTTARYVCPREINRGTSPLFDDETLLLLLPLLEMAASVVGTSKTTNSNRQQQLTNVGSRQSKLRYRPPNRRSGTNREKQSIGVIWLLPLLWMALRLMLLRLLVWVLLMVSLSMIAVSQKIAPLGVTHILVSSSVITFWHT